MPRILLGLAALALSGDPGSGRRPIRLRRAAMRACPISVAPPSPAGLRRAERGRRRSSSKFAYYDAHVIGSGLAIADIGDIRETRLDVDGPGLIPRRYCDAIAYLSNGRRSEVVYLIEFQGGLRLDPLGRAILPAGLRSLPGLRRLVPLHPSVRLRGLFAALVLIAAPALLASCRLWPAAGRAISISTSCRCRGRRPIAPPTDRPDPAECGNPLGFVVHGLWPEYERGYPADCPSNMPRRVSGDQRRPGSPTSCRAPGWSTTNGRSTGCAPVSTRPAYFATLRRAFGERSRCRPGLRRARPPDLAARDRAGLHRRQPRPERGRHRRHLPDAASSTRCASA